MKRINLISLTVCVAMILLGWFVKCEYKRQSKEVDSIKVGFLYVNDESAPYTYNFILAQYAIEEKYQDRVQVFVENNVPEDKGAEGLARLVDKGCNLIFTTSFGYQEAAKEFAAKYPDIQFCAATGNLANTEPVYDNFHTFMGRVHEGRYVSGIVAGMKLQEMVEKGEIGKEQAVIGYVAAFPYAEVISGYTAFFLGARSVMPNVTMKVRYTNSWSDYMTEKRMAKEMIEEGCVVIGQHSDTVGPAEACEEAEMPYHIYHVGYNQSMMDVAPTSTLVSARINWEPYMDAAVNALLHGKKIEKMLDVEIHGRDACGGMRENWVQMVELNPINTDQRYEEAMDEAEEKLTRGKINVFKGPYTGVDPFDANDTYDLTHGFEENEHGSAPEFHYVLNDVIEGEE